MAPHRDIAEALAHAARTINIPRDLEATLKAIVDTAARSLPGIEHVGISIAHRDGTLETRAATDDLVLTLDRIQYELGEGPCVHAVKAERVVRVEHIRHEQRWPRYVKAALEEGLCSQLGLRLYADDRTLGGLNLYSTTSDTIDDSVEHVAELFAAHAAIALGRAHEEEQLQNALQSRKIIGQAIGIVMERYDLDEDQAFAYLLRVSSHSNVKLRDIAEELVQRRRERWDPARVNAGEPGTSTTS